MRVELNALMLSLPKTRRTLWFHWSDAENAAGQIIQGGEKEIPYDGLVTLDKAKSIIDAVGDDHWINLMLACRFSKPECLNKQADLVSEFRNPIIRAHEIKHLIFNAT